MASSSDYSDVFVSYRRKDVEFTKTLVAELQKAGKEVWVDWEDIPPGSVQFTDDIKRGLDGADTFLAVLTPDYLESTYCVDLELGYAVKHRKKIIPIVLKKFENYPIPDGIGNINWIYFTPHAGHENTFAESFPKIIEVMETDLDHTRKHRNYHLRAIEWDENDRAPSFLMDGAEITAAEDWLVNAFGKDPLPTDLHKEYVTLSRSHEDNRRRLLMSGVVVALVVTVILAILSVFFGFDAVKQREIAENALVQADVARDQAEQLASEVQTLFLTTDAKREQQQGDPILALALAQRAIENLNEPTPDVQLDYSGIIYRPGPRGQIPVDAGQVSNLLVSPNQAYVAISTCQADNVDICVNPRLLILNPQTWDTQHELGGLTGQVTALAFDKHSDRLAVAMCAELGDNQFCEQGTEIVVYGLTDGTELARWSGQSQRIHTIAFSSNGERLASGSWDATIAIWDAMQGEWLFTLEGHEDRVYGVAFAENDTRLLSSGCHDDCEIGDLILWDASNGDLLERYDDTVYATSPLLVAEARSQAVFQGAEGELIFWDIITGRIRHAFQAHPNQLLTLWMNVQATQLVASSESHQVSIWMIPIEGPPQSSQTFLVTDSTITGAGLVNEGQQMIVGMSHDPTVLLWDLSNGALANGFENFSAEATSMALSPDASQAAIINAEAGIILLDITTGEIWQEWETDQADISDIVYSSDGTLIATAECNDIVGDGCEEGRIRLRNSSDGSVWKDLIGHEHPIAYLDFSHDGSYLMSTSSEGHVIVWDVADGSRVHDIEMIRSNIRSIDFLPDGSAFMVSTLGEVTLFSMADGSEIASFDEIDMLENAVVLPNGTQIMTIDNTGLATIWDIATQEAVSSATVPSVSTTSNTWLIAVSENYIFVSERDHLYVLDMSGNKIREYIGMRQISDIAPNASGSQVLEANNSGLQLWRVDTFEELRQWAEDNRYLTLLSCDEASNYRIDTNCDDTIASE